MKLLLEANNEEELSYDKLLQQASTPNEIFKVIKKWMNENPNKSNIENAYNTLEDSVLETHSLDEEKNAFIYYLNNIKNKITDDEAALIWNIASEDNLDVTEDWLYNKSLYEGSPEDVQFKIKAMTYASNPNLQRGANQQLVKSHLLDDNNNIKPVDDIKQILKNITITRKHGFENQTIKDAVEILKQSNIPNSEINQLIKDNPPERGEGNPAYITRLFKARKIK